MHQSVIRPVAIALCCGLLSLSAHADTKFHIPQPGSRERRAILDAIRPQVEAAYQLRVKFSVRGLESNGAIALVFVEPMDHAGNIIGARATKNARGETQRLDGWVFAIVEMKAKTWRVSEIDMLESVDGLTIWPPKYPAIPEGVFEEIGVATNAEG